MVELRFEGAHDYEKVMCLTCISEMSEGLFQVKISLSEPVMVSEENAGEVEQIFGEGGQFDLNFIRVNAQQRYYDKLAGVEEPEKKRKIIGEEFIRVFEEKKKKIGTVDFLAQGTIYPDVVESGLGGESAVT